MSESPKKRHSKWYEIVFLNRFFVTAVPIVLFIFLPAWILWHGELWGKPGYTFPWNTRLNTIYGLTICSLFIASSLYQLLKYPGNRSHSFIIYTMLFWYGLLLAIFLLLRIEHSNLLLGITFVLTVLYTMIGYQLTRHWFVPKIGLIPFGSARELLEIPNAKWVPLEEPRLDGQRRFNMITADFTSCELDSRWQKFLTTCALHGLPVVNDRQVEESLTGRVKIRRLYENELGSLVPGPSYSFIKRFMDIVLVLLTFPITLPIMLITAIVVMLESPGGALFIQNRVGKGSKDFRIYKFRSMCKDSESKGAQFATQNDARVTRVGKFIRKTRIDELPQFFNILKGDMSLIGPRPEQRKFVDTFEEEIPFYNYRHMVRPGISGWAQVMQGYTANAEETQVKIEYDFYYIKNFSLWLDILIVFKTLKTMLTGFGSR